MGPVMNEATLMTPAILKELQDHFGTPTVTSGELYAYNPKYMAEARKGGLKLVSRGVWSLDAPKAKKAPKENAKDQAAKSELIKERFEVLGVLADGVASNNIRSLIVAGAPGVGKTFTLEAKLAIAEKKKKITSVVSIKGSISPIGLYVQLFENREKGQVIVLDDIDSVFGDEEAMNLLKGALDTTQKRRISWAKASAFLRDQDIPNSFDYDGQIVFITNTDPDAVIAKGGKLAPHMAALLSRSVFLDLCIHDNKSIMIRVEQVLAESTMLSDLNVSKGHAAEILGWMNANLDSLRSVSLRTVIQLASFIKTSNNWQALASATMLKARY